jgi:serine/threonine protein kinase/tetratricopeptide (TPR) repeat protein
MIGKSVSHYRITDKLGEGGMGEVYLAEDTKLNRKVALKFLPVQLASDGELKERFKREAQAAAALNHPNIITIHEVAEHQARPFIAMEYVEGESLKDLIARKELSTGEVLDIALQVSDGLAVAHQAGIVHRDIKPQNILMGKDGRVRICDFGLAKAKRDVTLTQAGSTLGTIAYMSPEQAQGKEADHRSDIFSFGVVLYELLTGRLPFQGDHEAAVLHAIINEEPQPVARFNNQVSAKLEDVVSKALAKHKEERYQHIDDLLADLRRERKSLDYVKTGPPAQPVETRKPVKKKTLSLIVAGLAVLVLIVVYFSLFHKKEPESGRKMLAVLPFENLGAPEQEYFASGITEEITTHLAKVSNLGVISRTSVLQYKDTKKTVQQIGRELGVQYVLEGTILWDKSEVTNRVRINPQLIRVKDGTHVWAETYDRVLEQIFALQSDIAEKVASALNITLLEAEQRYIAAKPTENLEAYEYYLRGMDYSNRSWAEKDFRIAIEIYENAVELDPTFALAYASLSQAHSRMYWYYYDRTDERLNKAKEAVDRALELKPDLPEAHLALGYYYYWGSRDYERALEQFAIGQKGQPNNSDLLAAIGYVQRRQGKFQQAVSNLKKAAELNPRSHTQAAEVASTYLTMRKYAEAEYYSDRAISLAPDWPEGYIVKARLYVISEGDTKRARKVLQEVTGKADVSQLVPVLVGFDVLDGDYQTALGRLPDLTAFIDEYGSNDTIAYFLTKAKIYGLLNQPELKLACYDSARIILENKVQSSPSEADFHSSLGITYAGFGRKEEAVREGKKGAELLPVSKDALYGPYYVQNLAQIYVMVGDYDAAIDRLEYLLSIPSWISVPMLRIDPTLAPLRNHPSFQKLLARKR